MCIKDKLVMAVTDYDRRQSHKAHYNPHALGIYFERVDEICADIDRGANVRQAVIAGFCDRLRDHCLRALGEPITTKEERDGQFGSVCYSPVTK